LKISNHVVKDFIRLLSRFYRELYQDSFENWLCLIPFMYWGFLKIKLSQKFYFTQQFPNN
jgi:hypothetical protein